VNVLKCCGRLIKDVTRVNCSGKLRDSFRGGGGDGVKGSSSFRESGNVPKCCGRLVKNVTGVNCSGKLRDPFRGGGGIRVKGSSSFRESGNLMQEKCLEHRQSVILKFRELNVLKFPEY
jgi:hypothetical protein